MNVTERPQNTAFSGGDTQRELIVSRNVLQVRFDARKTQSMRLTTSAISPVRTAVATAFTMVAFASNSVLCRLALGPRSIDAASFTTLRLISGALMLALIVGLSRGRDVRATLRSRSTWASAAMLFAYASAFAFAFLSLSAGTGALILFGCVQVTMIVAALLGGERPGALEWLGFVAAVAGLVYLVLPGLAAPSLVGSSLMGLAGVSWGLYSLRGRHALDPLAETTGNFLRAAPLALVASLIALPYLHLTPRGAVIACISGAVTSALGYVIWYVALRGLSATRAATVQLSVPVLAALGGVVFLSETLTLRLALASILILGGIGVAIAGRNRPRPIRRA